MAAALLVGLLCAGCSGDRVVGRSFASVAELERVFPGYRLQGRFGNHWPATVTDVRQSRDGAQFWLRSGVPQSYPGYDGFDFQVVFLSADGGKETVVVFRSRERL